MSQTYVAVAVLPLVFVLVIVMECSRLHCARVVQRRLTAQGHGEDAAEG